MRICIFDGILETHVGSSLERAFRKFGHETFNTGKIGSGFKFPKSYEDISHLEATVQKTIRFNPDVVFVMRPASLPHPLLEKLKLTGASLIAWFSDDPVLFDLSYGPILTEYDIVLHCGNERVLAFYEDIFGFATGVNFPFWTDHTAFPPVWGSRKPDTDLLFLGNVHDPVRRERYFALGDTDLDVRIHGNIGADYFGKSGGYLLTDLEVVNAASTTKLALNIPQFFKDHRGLETWFPGLDRLGYFEYPSRVVQYMAMGVPTISVVPGESRFETYPEMGIADDMQGAYDLATQWLVEGELEKRSQEVLQRFDKHFSADARVMAIEHLLEDDSWRRLDSRERSQWFEQFDASECVHGANVTGSVGERRPVISSSSSFTDPNGTGPSSPKSVVVLAHGADESYSVASSVIESLEEQPNFATKVIQLERNLGLLTADPQKTVDNALVVGNDLIDNIKNAHWLIVVGKSIAITQAGAERLNALGVRTAIFCDQSVSVWSKVKRLLEGYDGVLTPNYAMYKQGVSHGYENIAFVPYFVRRSFHSALARHERRPSVVRVRETSKHEETMSPSIYNDAQFLTQEIIEYSDLEKLTFDELARTLKTELTFMTFAGTRSAPRITPLSPYVAVASKLMFSGRPASAESLHPYEEICYSAHDPGELKAKLIRIETSSLPLTPGDPAILEMISDSRHFLAELTDLLDLPKAGRSSEPDLVSGTQIEIPLVRVGNTPAKSLRVRIWVKGFVGNLQDWCLKIWIGNKVEYSIIPSGFDEILIDEVRDSKKVRVEACYSGRALSIPRSLGLTAEAIALPSLEIIGSPSASRVYRLLD
ncbi:hypothetical protein QP868_06210 [Brevibacterium sp. UMB1308A]|uniref:hypothetical protein n=1 Tax=Brevibacterium sp. UMB1308A TaxID=3050608 RepID=UPI00254F5C56|nr:hypothetical protein [Brevibacterium sp. UMB1308A]MDK8346582.1 hypothetical protein [Brevibacterium sp. UMB1308B]MDK8713491.1 hypothetical protein [Brevibacterium sp. UMB1308A]